MLRRHIVGFGILVLVVGGVEASSGWRGEGGGEFDASKPPVTWSADAHVRWKVKLPGWSNASPAVAGKRVLVGLEETTLLCLSLEDGSTLWQADHSYADAAVSPEARAEFEAGTAEAQRIQAELDPIDKKIKEINRKLRKEKENAALKQELAELQKSAQPLYDRLAPYRKYTAVKTHATNGYSTPTPLVVGDTVYAAFGNGVVASYTLEGQRRWIRDVGRPSHGWGHSASPVLADDTLMIHYGRVVHALDPATGAERWTCESDSTWGTPATLKVGDVALLLTTGGDLIRVDKGTIVAAKIAKMPWSSPLVQGDRIYVTDETEFCALQVTPAVLAGAKPEKLWSLTPKKDRYYASPICHDGLLYGITKGGHLTVVDAESGAKVYERDLTFPKAGGYTVYPSPVRAGELLYISTDNGSTLVLKPGRTYEELAGNVLEPFRSCPVLVGDRMLIRGLTHLWCIDSTVD